MLSSRLRSLGLTSPQLSRSLTTASNQDGLPELYQYAICPFCNRVKAFLDYASLDYSPIEVNPLTKAEIKWSQNYKKVPILKTNDDAFRGSDVIIENLLDHPVAKMNLENRWKGTDMTVEKFALADLSKEWSAVATDELASLLYPNICRTLGDSYSAFAYIESTESFGPFQKITIRGLGSLAMYLAANRVKKKRGITDERKALDMTLQKIESDGLQNGSNEFVSGTVEPNMGDISLYGTLKSIQGLPAHTEAVVGRGGVLLSWYNRMSAKVDRV